MSRKTQQAYNEKVCASKRRFSCKKVAKEAVKLAKGSVRLEPYQCDVCGLWHLRNRRKRKKREKAKRQRAARQTNP